jgi:hypothetical protein
MLMEIFLDLRGLRKSGAELRIEPWNPMILMMRRRVVPSAGVGSRIDKLEYLSLCCTFI